MSLTPAVRVRRLWCFEIGLLVGGRVVLAPMSPGSLGRLEQGVPRRAHTELSDFLRGESTRVSRAVLCRVHFRSPCRRGSRLRCADSQRYLVRSAALLDSNEILGPDEQGRPVRDADILSPSETILLPSIALRQ